MEPDREATGESNPQQSENYREHTQCQQRHTKHNSAKHEHDSEQDTPMRTSQSTKKSADPESAIRAKPNRNIPVVGMQTSEPRRTERDRERESTNRTSGQLKVVMLMRPLDTSELRTHQRRSQSHNSNRTSGHLEVVIRIRPLDTYKEHFRSDNANRTSGHL